MADSNTSEIERKAETVEVQTVTVDIFPNPASNVFNVTVNAPVKGAYRITVREIAVKPVLPVSNRVTDGGTLQIRINVSDLSSGIYLLQAEKQVRFRQLSL